MHIAGRKAGAVSDERWKVFVETRGRIQNATKLLKDIRLSPQVRHIIDPLQLNLDNCHCDRAGVRMGSLCRMMVC